MSATVVRMDSWVDRKTVTFLAALLELAERGEISGVALCYRSNNGGEHAEITGHYKRVPKDGLASAMRLSWLLTQAQNAMQPP